MKISLLLTLFCLFAIVLPATAQNPAPEIPKPAHETVIDGRWETKLTTPDKPVTLFEFKNATGTVSGTVTQDGNPTEIKNGTLEGTRLIFETTTVSAGESGPVTMKWTGTIMGEGESIQLKCAPVEDGSRVPSQQMEARRVE